MHFSTPKLVFLAGKRAILRAKRFLLSLFEAKELFYGFLQSHLLVVVLVVDLVVTGIFYESFGTQGLIYGCA